MQTENVSPASIETFQRQYLAELDERVKRSEVAGAITLKKGSAALFYDARDGKFTLVEKMPDVEEAHVFDCEPREQWGRTVMLFGHATSTGGYIPSGHATLDGSTLKIKLASGHYYRLDVDATQVHLQPFAGAAPTVRETAPKPEKKAPARAKKNPARQPAYSENQALVTQESGRGHASDKEESEDLTEDDLRRLRGELPLSSRPKKKWQH